MQIDEIDSKRWNTSTRNSKLMAQHEFQRAKSFQSSNNANSCKSLLPFQNGNLKSKVEKEQYESNSRGVENDSSSKIFIQEKHIDAHRSEIFGQESCSARLTKSCKSYFDGKNGTRLQIKSTKYSLSITAGNSSTFQCSSRKRTLVKELDLIYGFINNDIRDTREYMIPSKKAKTVQKFFEADTEPEIILQNFEADEELEEEEIIQPYSNENETFTQESIITKLTTSCKAFFGGNSTVSRL
uniref:Uncharacterized protein n=1 Tax=Panagrolaimus sp. PS1159 TaxID=55785 RepID=A0AC35FSV6_9BILA